jgi:GH43 family beta-xylosidase
MQKFTWNGDGTPNFGEPVPINTSIKKPAGE